MTSSDPTSANAHALGSLSRGIVQDTEDAYLINEVTDLIYRPERDSKHALATALLYVHEDNPQTVPVFLSCLTKARPENRVAAVSSVYRAIRDIASAAATLEKKFKGKYGLSENKLRGVLPFAWFPNNLINVLSEWYIMEAAPESENIYDHDIWHLGTAVKDSFRNSSGGAPAVDLHEFMEWAVNAPDVQRITALINDRGIVSIDEIESIMTQQDEAPAALSKGAL